MSGEKSKQPIPNLTNRHDAIRLATVGMSQADYITRIRGARIKLYGSMPNRHRWWVTLNKFIDLHGCMCDSCVRWGLWNLGAKGK